MMSESDESVERWGLGDDGDNEEALVVSLREIRGPRGCHAEL